MTSPRSFAPVNIPESRPNLQKVFMLNDIITPQAQSMHLNFGQLGKSPQSISQTARINPNNNSLNVIKKNTHEKDGTRSKSKEDDSQPKAS